MPAGYQVLSIDLPEHGERKYGEEEICAVDSGAGAANGDKTLSKQMEANQFAGEQHWRILFNAGDGKRQYRKGAVCFADCGYGTADFDNDAPVKATEAQRQEKGKIVTDFGQTLSWQYLCWIREHALQNWAIPMAVLYAGRDTMTDYETIETFAKKHAAKLTVYEQGEHRFHAPEQLEVLKNGERGNLL